MQQSQQYQSPKDADSLHLILHKCSETTFFVGKLSAVRSAQLIHNKCHTVALFILLFLNNTRFLCDVVTKWRAQ